MDNARAAFCEIQSCFQSNIVQLPAGRRWKRVT